MRSRLPSFVSPRPSFFPAASHIKPLGQGSLLLFRRRGGKLFVFELPSRQQTSVKGGVPSLVLVLLLSTASDGTMQSVEGSKRICILLYLRSEIVFCSHLFLSLFPPLFLVLLIKTFTPLLPPPSFSAKLPSLLFPVVHLFSLFLLPCLTPSLWLLVCHGWALPSLLHATFSPLPSLEKRPLLCQDYMQRRHRLGEGRRDREREGK